MMSDLTKKRIRFLVLSWFVSVGSLGAEALRVVGSDSVGRMLNLESEEMVDSLAVENRTTGSLAGLLKVQEGNADLAFVIQTNDGYPDLKELDVIPLGFWSVCVVVHEDNPLAEVSLVKLQELVLKAKDGLRSEWGMLVPKEPRWSNRVIFVTVDVRPEDPSYPLFVDSFLEGVEIRNQSSIGEKLENPYLAGSSNLLFMAHMPEPGKRLKTVSLIEDGSEIGYPPTPENLYFADYPLRMSLYLVSRDMNAERIRYYIQFFFESGRLNSLIRSGLIPVPNNVQKEALLEFDLDF